MYYQTLLFLGTAVAAAAAASPPISTAAQLRLMRDVGLAQFMHFSVNPWSSIEHNCVGDSPECISR